MLLSRKLSCGNIGERRLLCESAALRRRRAGPLYARTLVAKADLAFGADDVFLFTVAAPYQSLDTVASIRLRHGGCRGSIRHEERWPILLDVYNLA